MILIFKMIYILVDFRIITFLFFQLTDYLNKLFVLLERKIEGKIYICLFITLH